MSWFKMIEYEQTMPGVDKMGWAKIPFVNGFRYLIEDDSYKNAVGNANYSYRKND